ncbi:hypothetical protein SUVZ_06G0880 [Saccharomyces uvarum]|uniref:BHLH domain-containing protein n=1 Tax=Saccharomyces uvarum TaxID=230603 RepID=A0ABN8WSI3_SACUV|nr:hypothetical protein SUVZ_06G0880 [Saccharomyces uvarum]
MGRTSSEGLHGYVDDLEPKSSILDKVGDFITVAKRHGEREDVDVHVHDHDHDHQQENENENENENDHDELALDDLDRAFELVEGMDMDWMMPSHAHHAPATTTIKPRLLYSPLIHTQTAVPVTISPNLMATTFTSANKITKNKNNSSPYLNKRSRGKPAPDSAASLFELPDSVIPTPKPKPKQYPKVILPSNSTRHSSSQTTKMTTTTTNNEGVVVASESPVIAPHGAGGGGRPLSRRRSSGLLVDDDKRESHKHAEQARRNRLAVALHELAGLIPAEWKQQHVSTAPSKATTVEAACRYIRHLQRHGST